MQLVRVWLEERRLNKKADSLLLNGDKDRNRKSWELNVLNLLYSRFFFFVPQKLVRKVRLPNQPVQTIHLSSMVATSLSNSVLFTASHFRPDRVLLSPLPLSYLPHKIFLLSSFALRELCEKKMARGETRQGLTTKWWKFDTDKPGHREEGSVSVH